METDARHQKVLRSQRVDQALKLCFAGASLDTGNLGVSALYLSVLRAIVRTKLAAEVTAFDEGKGCRYAGFETDGQSYQVRLCGEKSSRRYWQAESLWNIRISSLFGGMANASARAILDADAVLDISGGDSFTDLYGPRVFRSVTFFKQIVLENQVPLVLLPQTYGPFTNSRNRRVAESIVRRSQMAWARDERSFDRLKELLGKSLDQECHRCGVDVAFALESVAPSDTALQPIADWLQTRTTPLVGINVSGLIHNNPVAAVKQYGFKADYCETIKGIVGRLLRETGCRILLIPHVITPRGHHESDVQACASVAEMLGCVPHDRVKTLPALDDARLVKWVIGRMDWFCGTRMHATIAALSSGVPTAAIAYSDKTQGVFETCGQGDCVVDPREMTTDDVIDRLWDCWCTRKEAAACLAQRLPEVIRRAHEQMEMIMRSVVARTRSHKSAGSKLR